MLPKEWYGALEIKPEGVPESVWAEGEEIPPEQEKMSADDWYRKLEIDPLASLDLPKKNKPADPRLAPDIALATNTGPTGEKGEDYRQQKYLQTDPFEVVAARTRARAPTREPTTPSLVDALGPAAKQYMDIKNFTGFAERKLGEGLLDWVSTPSKGYYHGLTPQQEAEFGGQYMLGQLPLRMPKRGTLGTSGGKVIQPDEAKLKVLNAAYKALPTKNFIEWFEEFKQKTKAEGTYGEWREAINKFEDQPVSQAKASKPLNLDDLSLIGPQLGTVPGGQFKDAAGNKYYIKMPQTAAHARNEYDAAALYKLAGAKTFEYVPFEGTAVATKWEKLHVDNYNKFKPSERKAAQADFVTHAWTANWDAVGLTGDNLGISVVTPTSGSVVTMDLGGALRFRAQGEPKGKEFGPHVSELVSMRESKQGKPVFGDMTHDQIIQSAYRVTNIPDTAILAALKHDPKLAELMVARKHDIANRLGLPTPELPAPTGKSHYEQVYKDLAAKKAQPAKQDYVKNISITGWKEAKKIDEMVDNLLDEWKTKKQEAKLKTTPLSLKEWMQQKSKHTIEIPMTAEILGFNPNMPLFKGGTQAPIHKSAGEERAQLKDPSDKNKERGLFFGDDPKIAEEYGDWVSKYVASPKNPAVIDMQGVHYDPGWMHPLIEKARKRGHDFLIIKNMIDVGSNYKPQNQYVVLDTSIVRRPDAKFNPYDLDVNHLLAGIAGASFLPPTVAEIMQMEKSQDDSRDQ